MKNDLVETDPKVLAGEPVIAGTRISVRLIADLIRAGAMSADVQDDFDLSSEQVEAAIRFGRIWSERERPRQLRNSE